jgi:isocitrate dehydrogenase (NAD+)
MLRHLGENEAADAILKATFAVLEEGKIRTADLGGKASTQEYAEAVIQKLD